MLEFGRCLGRTVTDGALHYGERYEVHLCETYFFVILEDLKQKRRTANLFEDPPLQP